VPVHRDPALRDQFLRLAARGQARSGDDLLQTLGPHTQPPVLSEAICRAACSSASSCCGSEETVGSVTFSGTSAWASAICSMPPSSLGVPVASATGPWP